MFYNIYLIILFHWNSFWRTVSGTYLKLNSIEYLSVQNVTVHCLANPETSLVHVVNQHIILLFLSRWPEGLARIGAGSREGVLIGIHHSGNIRIAATASRWGLVISPGRGSGYDNQEKEQGHQEALYNSLN